MQACGSSDDDPNSVSAADAYTAAIRWYVEQNPVAPPTTDDDEPEPLAVFVAPADGVPIGAQDQADVAANLADMDDQVVVRFADVRDDTLDMDLESEPVKDDGVLLLVGPVEPGPPPIDVEISVYRSIDDQSTYVMRVVSAGADEWNVTAVTELEQN